MRISGVVLLLLLSHMFVHFATAASSDLEQLRSAARAGDAQAQLQLGMEYFHGSRRTLAKPAEAMHWLNSAADAGNTEAMVFLAKLLRVGSKEMDRDLHRSFQLSKQAAAKGHAEGMDLLAEAYFNNMEVGYLSKKKRDQLAVKWLKKAATKDAFRAQVQLADAYREGKLVERDGERAVKWYLKAAANADKLSQSSRTVSPEATQMIQKVHMTLGQMFYKGHGAKKNATAALEHLSRAADLGSQPAARILEEVRKDRDTELEREKMLADPEIQKFLQDAPFTEEDKERLRRGGDLPPVDVLLESLLKKKL
eukprot:TRINITY_DN87663_c0_g1_i1.p1 TRINITY_DN87663_c0_g1~~TRINITY_DN87663_c0_g1_i1.p1  ORF type:complete len:310 (+),score=87.22 TRINITY_DN87663_c0_g1_i1:95-1024(+)